MIKIMHVCTDTNIGGAGRYLLNLLEKADQTNYDLYFVLPFNSLLKKLIEEKGGKVIETPISPNRSFHPKDIGVLRKRIKEIHPAIIHTHGSFSARIAGKLRGVKGIVFTRHYVESQQLESTVAQKDGLSTKLKKKLNNFLCDGVIGVAAECEPILLHMGISPSKIKIIPNGVTALKSYTEEEKLAVRACYGIKKEAPVIAILARLSREKGHSIFIAVIEEVVKTHPEIVAVIAGTGGEKEEIEKLVKEKGLEKHIILTGFVERVEDILNITSIQMNTSHTEAQSLALSEGMSLGVPAVVTAVGGNPSMIRNTRNGFVVEKEDIKGLASKVNLLLEDQPLYNKMCIEAREIYEAHYTAEAMTKSTEAFYQHILKKM